MRIRQLLWRRLLWLAPLVLALLLVPGMAVAQEAVTLELSPVGESGVSGTATLTAAGDGTEVTLEVQGLAPGADARASMHAGTCAVPSASFAALPDLQADASGRATATGLVLFRGTENVALATMADGEHVIIVRSGGQVVACGTIPVLTPASAPATLPATGGTAFPPMAAMVGILGLCALSAGLSVRLGCDLLQKTYP